MFQSSKEHEVTTISYLICFFFFSFNCVHVRFTHQHVGTHSACPKTNPRRMQKSCALILPPGIVILIMDVDITMPYFSLRSQLQPRVNRPSSLPGPQEALQSRLKEALEKETKVTRVNNSILVQIKLCIYAG